MYDPSIGRWLEQDPIGFDAGDTNLYRMVSNDPVDATDPTGLQTQDKKKPDWVPYMKGIEVQSTFAGEGQFRDALGNYVIIYRLGGDIYGGLEPGKKNPEGRNLEAPRLGQCKYPFGTNTWIFWTNDKGQLTKIVWVNLAPTIPGDPRLGVPPGVAAKAKEDLQKRLNTIIDNNRDNPDNALKEVQDLAKDPKIVDPKNQVIRIAWEGPFVPIPPKKKK